MHIELSQTIDWRLFAAIVAIAISLGSFSFNFYINIFKKASIKAIIGDSLTLTYGQNNELIFGLSLTLLNTGARFAAAVCIRGVIHKVAHPEKQAKVYWRSFYESKDIGSDGNEFKPYWSFKSWPTTIIINGYSACTENIKFKTSDKYIVDAGEYSIRLTLRDQNMKAIGEVQESFSLSQEDCIFLKEECQTNEKRIAGQSLVITRNFKQ